MLIIRERLEVFILILINQYIVIFSFGFFQKRLLIVVSFGITKRTCQ